MQDLLCYVNNYIKIGTSKTCVDLNNSENSVDEATNDRSTSQGLRKGTAEKELAQFRDRFGPVPDKSGNKRRVMQERRGALIIATRKRARTSVARGPEEKFIKGNGGSNKGVEFPAARRGASTRQGYVQLGSHSDALYVSRKFITREESCHCAYFSPPAAIVPHRCCIDRGYLSI